MLKQLLPLIEPKAMTVTGRTLAENLEGYEVANEEVIRPLERAYTMKAPIVILKGSLAPDSAVLDLAYRVNETAFVRDARARGHKAIDGLTMLVEQGALSFEQWFGVAPDRGAMWDAVKSIR